MIASYLSGGSQSVCSEDESLSDPIFTFFTGVPQGSILGPLLFAIFINDLPSMLQYSKHGIYVDDTRIFLYGCPCDLLECIQHLNQDAQAVFTWSISNLIKLIPDKTKLIVLGSELYISHIDFIILPSSSLTTVLLSTQKKCLILNVKSRQPFIGVNMSTKLAAVFMVHCIKCNFIATLFLLLLNIDWLKH